MSMIAGWSAIVLGITAGVIGIVPGAVSLMGVALSLLALMWSLVSITGHGCRYFYTTAALALLGIFLINDSMNIWVPSAMPHTLKVAMHASAAGIILFCFLVADRLTKARRKSSRSLRLERRSDANLP